MLNLSTLANPIPTPSGHTYFFGLSTTSTAAALRDIANALDAGSCIPLNATLGQVASQTDFVTLSFHLDFSLCQLGPNPPKSPSPSN